MGLHELVYVSLATHEMTLADLNALLDDIREKNQRLDITGLLVYHNGEFMQMLEGPKSDIFALYRKIFHDKRNQQHHLMWDGPIEQRSFAQWSMAFLHAGELPLDRNPAYSSFLKDGLSVAAGGMRR